MTDQQLGSAFRAMRVRRGLRQVDVGRRAVLSRSLVSALERGNLESLTVGALRRIASALEIHLDIRARWHGGELDRLLNAGHSALHEATAAVLDRHGWVFLPERSFSIYGERGVIDIVAWHAETRTLLVIELKTDIVDVQDVLGTLDRKTRLAAAAVRDLGWRPLIVATWLVVAETSTNRRRVAMHERTFRAALPAGGVEMRRWIRRPQGRIAALSFLSIAGHAGTTRRIPPIRRVRPPTSARRLANDRN